MRQDIESVLFTEEQIHGIVERIGAEISRDYQGKNLLLVSVLKGSMGLRPHLRSMKSGI